MVHMAVVGRDFHNPWVMNWLNAESVQKVPIVVFHLLTSLQRLTGALNCGVQIVTLNGLSATYALFREA